MQALGTDLAEVDVLISCAAMLLSNAGKSLRLGWLTTDPAWGAEVEP